MKNIILLLLLITSCETVPPIKEEPIHYLTPYGEKTKKWNPDWDQFIVNAITDDAPLVTQAPDEVKAICPKFSALPAIQKKIFWAYFVQAMTVAESGMSPTNRFKEPGMGSDPVTRLPVYSEGLLQMSYQDSRNHKGCLFVWEKDKTLAPTDIKKTILDPKTNLECGIFVLNKQILTRHQIFTQPNHYYWSVLNPVKNPTGNAVLKKELANVPAFCKDAS